MRTSAVISLKQYTSRTRFVAIFGALQLAFTSYSSCFCAKRNNKKANRTSVEAASSIHTRSSAECSRIPPANAPHIPVPVTSSRCFTQVPQFISSFHFHWFAIRVFGIRIIVGHRPFVPEPGKYQYIYPSVGAPRKAQSRSGVPRA